MILDETVRYEDIREGLTTTVSFQQRGVPRPFEELTREELYEAIEGLDCMKRRLLERLEGRG